MKQLFFLLLLLIGIAPIFAQSPALINYQAVVRGGNGALITIGQYSARVSSESRPQNLYVLYIIKY